MARGRMINSKITRNKAINDLSDDTSRLAFTWLVTFADVEGRTNGDPALVRSLVFPRRVDVTVEQMTRYIQEWAAAGLVTWYRAEGDLWIEFPSFADNQRGMDRRKEQPSDIPEPSDSVPSTYPARTEYVPDTAEENRTEQNRKEDAGAVAAPSLSAEAQAPNKEPRTRAPSEHDQIRDHLLDYFVQQSKLPGPLTNTTAQKKAAGRLWWAPLREIGDLAHWDVHIGERLIDRALEALDGLTVSDPNSIIKTVRSLSAEQGRASGADAEETERALLRARLDNLRFGKREGGDDARQKRTSGQGGGAEGRPDPVPVRGAPMEGAIVPAANQREAPVAYAAKGRTRR